MESSSAEPPQRISIRIGKAIAHPQQVPQSPRLQLAEPVIAAEESKHSHAAEAAEQNSGRQGVRASASPTSAALKSEPFAAPSPLRTDKPTEARADSKRPHDTAQDVHPPAKQQQPQSELHSTRPESPSLTASLDITQPSSALRASSFAVSPPHSSIDMHDKQKINADKGEREGEHELEPEDLDISSLSFSSEHDRSAVAAAAQSHNASAGDSKSHNASAEGEKPAAASFDHEQLDKSDDEAEEAGAGIPVVLSDEDFHPMLRRNRSTERAAAAAAVKSPALSAASPAAVRVGDSKSPSSAPKSGRKTEQPSAATAGVDSKSPGSAPESHAASEPTPPAASVPSPAAPRKERASLPAQINHAAPEHDNQQPAATEAKATRTEVGKAGEQKAVSPQAEAVSAAPAAKVDAEVQTEQVPEASQESTSSSGSKWLAAESQPVGFAAELPISEKDLDGFSQPGNNG